ncbi:MAG TPA: hypothetical protein VFN89_12635 [Solirubrobacterales bacterium]|nr:hypothetical protein [Solirubrobacterales bacterium]
MSGAQGQPPRQRGSSVWAETAADPTVRAIVFYALVALGAAVAAYGAIFAGFANYDDEGTVLVTLNAFAHGHPLYTDIFSPYGPFFFEFFGGLASLSGHAFTTDGSRTVVILVWIATSFVLGLACQRLTGRLTLGLAGMVVAFAVLYALFPEPMHPHGLLVLLLSGFVLVAVHGPGARPARLGALAGTLLAAALMTKINFGAYAIAAVVLAAALTVESIDRRPWLRWLLVVAFLAIPTVVMFSDLRESWVRSFIALELLGGGAIVAAAWPGRPRRGEEQGALTGWLLAALAGGVVAIVAILAAILLDGTSFSDLYDGLIKQPLNVRNVDPGPFETPGQAIDWGVAALAAAVLVTKLRSWASGKPSLWPGLLRAAAGLAIWFTIAKQAPFGLNPSANVDVLPMLLAWVAAVPPLGAPEPPFKRFLRVLLPAVAVAGVLGAYPVPGAQVGIASLMFVPVGALCLADALASLRAWSATRGELGLARFGAAAAVATAALAGMLALGQVFLPAISNTISYRERTPLPFPGAGQVRLTPEEVEEYEGVVDFIERNRCTSFVGYPDIDSLYLWTGIEAPKPYAPGAWITALDEAGQNRVLAQVRSSPRPCAFRNETVAGAWLGARPAPDTPLVHYIFEDFEEVEGSGNFSLLLPKKGS